MVRKKIKKLEKSDKALPIFVICILLVVGSAIAGMLALRNDNSASAISGTIFNMQIIMEYPFGSVDDWKNQSGLSEQDFIDGCNANNNGVPCPDYAYVQSWFANGVACNGGACPYKWRLRFELLGYYVEADFICMSPGAPGPGEPMMPASNYNGLTYTTGQQIIASTMGGQNIRVVGPPSETPKQFQPTATSSVAPTIIDTASNNLTITDTITAHTVGTTPWISGNSVRFDFDLYECTAQHPSTGDGNADKTLPDAVPSDCKKVATTNETFDQDKQSKQIKFIGDRTVNPNTDNHFAYSSGKNYYVVSRMEKSKQDGTNGYPNSKDQLIDSWYSPFSTANEQVKTTFSPEVTSRVSSNYITAGTDFVDQISVSAKTASVINAANGNRDTNPTWLKDDNNEYVKVKACVQAYGPAQGPYSATSGPFVPNTATDLPAELKTKAIGNPVCNDISPSLGNPAGTISFNIPTSGWAPGYYYFITTIKGDNQAADIADYLAGQSNFSYTSPFNPGAPQNEWGYIKFQPIARSMMEGNRYSEDKGTIGRGNNKGVVFDCDDNKTTFQYPGIKDADIPTKLTCKNITDHIYFGAADTRIVNNNIVENNSSYIKDEYWPKVSSATNADYEPIRYEVKLYGPFADPEGRNPASPGDALGQTITTVPYSDASNPAWNSAYAQPAARTGLLATGDKGPNWDGFDTIAKDFYNITFKQDANGGTTGPLTQTDLKLAPGFYISVVEIVKDGQTSNAKNLMANSFYSTWGDAYESLSVPLPVFVWSERDINSASGMLKIGDTVTDKIFIKGFNNTRLIDDGYGNSTQGPWQDAIGKNMHTHYFSEPDNAASSNNFFGKNGYFAADSNAKLQVTLYRYDHKPTADDCKATDTANIAGGPWLISAKDTSGTTPVNIPYPAYTVTQSGYYVFHITYAGDERVYPFSSKCDDSNEQFDSTDESPTPTPTPTINTEAQAEVLVGDPFHDIANVNLPTDDKEYLLYFTAYKAAECPTNVFWTNQQNPITITKSGSYNSPDITAQNPGYIYWIETLIDKETGQTVAEGGCGRPGEITYVRGRTTSQPPVPPSAGIIIRDIVIILGLGSVIGIAVWQLTGRKIQFPIGKR